MTAIFTAFHTFENFEYYAIPIILRVDIHARSSWFDERFPDSEIFTSWRCFFLFTTYYFIIANDIKWVKMDGRDSLQMNMKNFFRRSNSFFIEWLFRKTFKVQLLYVHITSMYNGACFFHFLRYLYFFSSFFQIIFLWLYIKKWSNQQGGLS